MVASLFEYISNKNYRLYEIDIISFLNNYKHKNKHRFSYWEIQVIDQIVLYILISKLYEIIMLSYPDIIKENTRKNVQIYNIILTINDLYNWDMDKILLNTSDCDNLLLRINEYKYLDSYSRNKYREKIKYDSMKRDKTEYIYAMELIKKYRNTNKCLCELLFRRINYKFVNILIIILSIIFSFLILHIIFINKLLIIPMLLINYVFLYSLFSSIVPKEFIPKYNIKNNFKNNKIMVLKCVNLTNEFNIEKELKILEKIYLENKSNDIDYTLCIESDKPIKDLKKYDNNLINKAYIECKKLNNKHYRKIFSIIYIKNDNYNNKNDILNFFNGLLLNKKDEKNNIDYFLGNIEFKDEYKYVLNINRNIKSINISLLINYLLHPYNKPIFKNNRLTYGYGSISLDGVNLYNESIDSDSYIYDLELFDKLFPRVDYKFINFLRDYSVNNNKSEFNIYFIADILNVIKVCFKKNNYLNIVFTIKYFHKLINILGSVCSFILLIYMLFSNLSFLWIIYLIIVTPNFIRLPSVLSFYFFELIYTIIKKFKKFEICKRFNYVANYIICLFILINMLILKIDFVKSCLIIGVFLYIPIIKLINRKKRSDNID